MNTRDVGLRGSGAGKGDADRTTDATAYRRNVARVKFTGVDMDRVSPTKQRKVYGPRKPTALADLG